jgi:hypothetical protein
MKKTSKARILELLAVHRIMTVATVRSDGWPQATTVGFVNDGLVLYFLCARDSQKAVNIARDDRISLTIDHDTTDPTAITGLSMAARAKAMSVVEGAMWEARHRPMAARATAVSEAEEVAKALKLLTVRYPEYVGPLRPPADYRTFCVMRVVPEVISILDFSKGFGHTELVTVGQDDLRADV